MARGGSRGVLVTLSAIAAALLVAMVLDDGRDGAVVESRRVVPGFRPDSAERIALRHAGAAEVVLARDTRGEWHLVEPVTAPVDAAAVDDLLGTVELLRWRRRMGAPSGEGERGLSPPRVEVEIERGGRAPVTLGVGARIEAVEGAWLRRGETDYVVDGHAARSLSRTAADFRARRPLPFEPDAVVGIEIHAGVEDLVLGGHPLAVHLDGGGAVRADPEAVAALVEQLAELRLLRFLGRSDEPPLGTLSVRVIGAGPPVSMQEVGPCPGADELRRVDSSAGPGCVEAGAIQTIASYAGRRGDLFDDDLIYRSGDSATSFAVEAGETAVRAEARGAVWMAGVDDRPMRRAEARAIRDWLGELADTTVETVPLSAVEVGPPEATIEVVHAGDVRETISVHRHLEEGLLARRGDEPLYWALSPDSIVELMPPAGFRSRQLVAEEPTALREVVARARGREIERLERGELIDDWSAPVGGAILAGAVPALRRALASLRAERFVGPEEDPELDPPRRVVEVVFDPPPGGGGAIRHRIEIGAVADEGGCYARVDDDAEVVLDPERCEALIGPWTR